MKLRRWHGVGLTMVAGFGAATIVASHHPPPSQTTPAAVSTTVAKTTMGDCKMLGADSDPVCTPGAINGVVTQANIQSTICKAGWTATVRPPVSYTDEIKRNMLRSGTFTATYRGQHYTYRGYGVGGSPSDFELDHDVPLEVGGSPADPKNLFPEPAMLKVGMADAGYHVKDVFENVQRRKVCAGVESLADAQGEFLSGWHESWLVDGKPAR